MVYSRNRVKLYNNLQGSLQELISVADNKFMRKDVGDAMFEFTSNNGKQSLVISSLQIQVFKKLN
jgi:hypothetical protein